jgi:diguanylate cyclase (GGDEF)-like protein
MIVLVSGLITAGLVSWWLPATLRPELIWIGPLLAAGFLLAEQLAVNIDVRGGVSWTISFTEIPLVIGLFVAPFQVVLAAHLVAGVGTLLARRVQDKVVYNTGAEILEISSAFAVATLVNSALTGWGPPWLGVLAGAVAAPLISTLLALVGLDALGRKMRTEAAIRLVGRILVLGVVNASVGVVGYEVATSVEAGWLLVLIAFGGLCALYGAYSGLVREQRDLEALSDVSLTVARSGHQAAARPATGAEDTVAVGGGEWDEIALRIKDQLGAARVVLRLQFDQQRPMHTVVSGEPMAAELHAMDATGPRADALLRLPGSHVRHFRASDAVPEIGAALARRSVREALVVPLRGASHLLGVVEAHNKLSRWRDFGQADLRMMGTMASHLATAMDNRRLLATLRHDAYHDPLTGLLNRPGFRQAAGEHLRANPGSVVLRIDMDVLSTISDALGYAWSDRMVVAAGRRLYDALGPGVSLARLESGAFAALLVNTSLDQAHATAERLCAELSASYSLDRITVEAGAVIGYSRSAHGTQDVVDGDSPPGPDVDTLLQHADVALRSARSNGEKVRGYLPSMGQIFLRRFQLVSQFRQALETGQVKVHYQPKVALPSRQLLGVEALVRWRHPEFGALSPDEFVPAVEAGGLVDTLTDFVMEFALIRVRKWLDEGLRLSVAVNISVRSLDDGNFPDRVAERLAQHGVPPELLTLELTESGVMADPQRALPVLRRLHALGVVLAVDDFGTGYSSLAYLRQLPVDEVKIDKSFVLGMGSDLGDLAVVRSIVELGHSLGLTVVAEGVEEDVARDQLAAMDCDVAQGYLISRPLSEGRLEAWLQARTAQAPGLRDEMVLTLLS